MKYWQIKSVTLFGIIFFAYFLGMVTILLHFSHLDSTDDLRKISAQVQIEHLKRSLAEFKMDNGFYPTTEQGLDALFKKPTVEPIPKKYKDGGYLAKIFKDPWGNPYVYISMGEFEIISSDGQRGSSQ